MTRSLILAISICSMLNAHGAPTLLDLRDEKDGVQILKNHSATPDSKGVMDSFKLTTPKFTRGVYYSGQWWQ